MTSKTPKVSVIIPVYNAEAYLERCLESVCNQTLKDIEIICVDDCSTDASSKILGEYAKKYKNLIFCHHKENQGESEARNSGVSLAKGEYLGFVDNDDEIDLNFYEKLYNKAKEKDSDIVKGQAVEISYDGHKHFIKQLAENGNKMLFLTYWWTAIYKRSLIVENNISFPTQHPLGGDLLFLNKAVIAAKDLQVVNDVYYYYYRREDSGDSKILPEVKVKSALRIYEMVVDNINSFISAGNPLYNFIFHHFIIACFYLSLKSNEEKVKELCAKVAVKIFEKSCDKNGLQFCFSQTAPHLFTALRNQDINSLNHIFLNCKSRMELIVSGLRSRIKNK